MKILIQSLIWLGFYLFGQGLTIYYLSNMPTLLAFFIGWGVAVVSIVISAWVGYLYEKRELCDKYFEKEYDKRFKEWNR